MKKNYVKPAVEEVQVEPATIIAGSPFDEGGTGNTGVGSGKGDGDDMTRGHRGSWGDLWD